MKNKLTKKEEKLYYNHSKQCAIIIRHYITLSYTDSENLLKVNERMLEHCNIIIQRKTWRFKLITKYLYFNTMYGGVYDRSN